MRIAFVTALAFAGVAASPALAQTGRPGNWQGVYVGGTIGGAVGKASPANTSGFTGNAHVGVNGQFDRVIVGVEADAGLTSNGHTGFNTKFRQGANGSMRARAGVAFDRVLVYGTGGIAASNFNYNNNGRKDDVTRAGTVLGVGAELMLTDNLAARAEYLRYDFNRSNFSKAGGPTSVSPNNNVLRGGMSYRF
jgi:outer membrane immunogenic protein